MSRRLVVVLALLPVLFVVAGCGGAAPPPAEQTPPAAPAQPAVSASEHMKEHFEKFRELEEAIIRGDIESARAPAQWIAEHQEVAGLPEGTENYVTEMRSAAKAVAASNDIGNAAVASAKAIATCGGCHAAAKVTPPLPEASAVSDMAGAAGHMHGHQQAIDLLYRGLAAPSDEMWKKGAEGLRVAPLAEKDLAKVTKEIQRFEARVHELAGRAADAPDSGAKVAIYGEIIGGCATCHGLHGKVWGPGLPKTN
jgi:hypothetical protein